VIDPAGLGNLVAEYDSAGNLIAHYGQDKVLLLRTDASGQSEYYATDGVGNIAGLTGDDGGPLNTYAYDPFGKVIYQDGSVENAFQFGGAWGVTTESNGLDFMRARFYDPGVGRFQSPDPVVVSGTDANLYSYASNNPLTFIDPSGERIYIGFVRPGQNGHSVGLTIGRSFAVSVGASVGPGVGVSVGPSIGYPPGVNNVWIAGVGASTGMQAGVSLGYGYGTASGFFMGWTDEEAPNTDFIEDSILKQCGEGGGLKPIPADVQRDRLMKNLMKWNAQWLGNAVGSMDPNQKLGPAGYGPQGYVAPAKPMAYTVDFENDPSATAPAQYVVVVDSLDPNLDWSTFQLTEVGFGDSLLAVPPNTQHFETVEPMTLNGQDVEVHVTAGIDMATGQVRVTFSSIDPQTGLPPEVGTGFLPPEDGIGCGQGCFGYLVRTRDHLADGTQIRNVATIAFDFGETIATNQVDPHDPSKGTDPAKECLNTVDATPPSRAVAALPTTTRTADFLVSWSGNDALSGVAIYEVYVRDDNGPWTLWQDGTRDTAAIYPGVTGHTYDFYSRAIDNGGLQEAAPAGPDATTTLQVNDPPRIDSLQTSPGDVLQDDLLVLTAHGAADDDGTVAKVEFYGDQDGDGVGEPSEKIGDGVNQAGDWVWSGPVTWGGGARTYLAQATNDEGGLSPFASAAGTVTIPGIDVPIGDGLAAKTVTFTDADGTRVTVTLTGGRATVTLYGRTLVQNPPKGGIIAVTGPATPTGQNVRIGKIALTGTTSAGALVVATKGGTVSGATVGDIVGDGSMSKISGPTLDLLGDLNLAGTLAALTLGSVKDGHRININSSGAHVDPKKIQLAVILDQVKDCSLDTHGFGRFRDTAGASA